MRGTLVIAVVFVATSSGFAIPDSSSRRLEIVSPPDRFFAASDRLDLTVAAAPRSDDRALLLRVDGSSREEVRLPAHGGSVTHTFQIPVSPLDPPAFIE